MRYVALLRAINVGGHTVKMDALRAMFEALGLSRVETVIASGNVLFDASGSAAVLERKIEKHLAGALGYEVATFLRSSDEMHAAAALEPFRGLGVLPPGQSRHVGFLKQSFAGPAARDVAALSDTLNSFHASGREVHWHARDRDSFLKLAGASLEKRLGGSATFRNLNTVRRLAEKL
jgi:uncharacterized protein (DUF1697 family)